MNLRRQAIEAASPTGQGIRPNLYGVNFVDRMMLWHLSRVAMTLPESFEEESVGGLVFVSGETSDDKTTIKVRESFMHRDFSVTTTVDLSRSEIQPSILTRLEATKHTLFDDDTYSNDFFKLGDGHNSMSLFKVMRSVDLAARVVNEAAALEYLARPEVASTGNNSQP